MPMSRCGVDIHTLIHSCTQSWSTYYVPAAALAGFMRRRGQTARRALLSFLLSRWRRQSRNKRTNSETLRGHMKVIRWSGMASLRTQPCEDFWGEHAKRREESVQRPRGENELELSSRNKKAGGRMARAPFVGTQQEFRFSCKESAS